MKFPPARIIVNSREVRPAEFDFQPKIITCYDQMGMASGYFNTGEMTLTLKFSAPEWEKVREAIYRNLKR